MSYLHTESGPVKTDVLDAINAPRLGLKAETALPGAGASVLLTLEYALHPFVNLGIGKPTRETSLALKGRYGSVSAGRLPTPGYRATLKYDALPGQYSPLDTLSNTGGTNFKTTINQTSRFDNLLTFQSAPVEGVSATLGYSLGGFSAPSGAGLVYGQRQERIWVMAAELVRGPWQLTYVAHRLGALGSVNTAGAVVQGGSRQSENLVGASVDLGACQLFATWQDVKQNTTPSDRLWQMGTRIPVRSAQLSLSVAGYRNGMQRVNSNAASWAAAWSLALTPMTRVFAVWQRVLLDAGSAPQNRVWAIEWVAPTPRSVNGNSTGYLVGVEQRF